MHRRILAGVAVAVAVAGGGVAGALIGAPAPSGAQGSTATSTTTTSTAATPPSWPGARGAPAELEAAAAALGLTPRELVQKLGDGTTTIADVARQEGVALSKVEDAMLKVARDRIDRIVHHAWPPPPPGGKRFGPGFGRGLLGSLDAAAGALGITPEQLRDDLRSGDTIADVARSKGVDVQKAIDAMVADAASRLAAAVKDGRIPAGDADQIQAGLRARITDLVSHGFPSPPAGLDPGPGFGDEPCAQVCPAP